MRRVIAGVLAAAVAFAAAGCGEQSRVDPDAAIRISGQVRAPDGSPLADRPVRLGGGIGATDVLAALLTLGLACAGGGCEGSVFDASTDASGRYEFVVRGRDTQSGFGEAVSQLLSVSASPARGQVSGPASSARFKVQTEDVRLPTLDLVDPGLVVRGENENVVARWSTQASGPYELTFEAAEPVPVWRVSDAEGSVVVDPRIIEDTAGRVVVSGGSVDQVEGSEVVIRWRSPGVAYAGGAGAPSSRGRSCRYLGPDEAPEASFAEVTSCALTDGDLTGHTTQPTVCPSGRPVATGEAAAASGCTRAVSVVIDLGQPLPAELVVVRGCPGGCSVDVSADGASYEPAGSAANEYGAVALAGGPVRFVRVGLGTATGSGVREVSVWGPRPADQPLLELADAERDRLARPFGFSLGGGGSLPLPLVMAALLALLGAITGFALVALRSLRR